MSIPTIVFTLVAIAARRVLATDDEDGVASGGEGAQAVMNATQPATSSGSGSTGAPLHTTPFNNAIPYCSFSGGKIQCDPLTTHQKLFVILSATILALLLLFLITLCCCCCCSRRRNSRKVPPSIYVSSSSGALEAPPSGKSQGPYYGPYGSQAPYAASSSSSQPGRLNDPRSQAPQGSGGTAGNGQDRRQAVYGLASSRT